MIQDPTFDIKRAVEAAKAEIRRTDSELSPAERALAELYVDMYVDLSTEPVNGGILAKIDRTVEGALTGTPGYGPAREALFGVALALTATDQVDLDMDRALDGFEDNAYLNPRHLSSHLEEEGLADSLAAGDTDRWFSPAPVADGTLARVTVDRDDVAEAIFDMLDLDASEEDVSLVADDPAVAKEVLTAVETAARNAVRRCVAARGDEIAAAHEQVTAGLTELCESRSAAARENGTARNVACSVKEGR